MTHLNACELSENVSVGPSKTQTRQSRSANSRGGLGCNTNRSNTFSTLADLPREAGTRTNSLGYLASHLSGSPRVKVALGRKAYLRSISVLLSEKPCRRQPSCSRSSNAWRTHWKSQRRKATGGHSRAHAALFFAITTPSGSGFPSRSAAPTTRSVCRWSSSSGHWEIRPRVSPRASASFAPLPKIAMALCFVIVMADKLVSTLDA